MRRVNSLEKTLMLGKIEGKWRRAQQGMRWLDSITDSVDMNSHKLWEILENRGAWCVTVPEVPSQTGVSNWKTSAYTILRSSPPFLSAPHLISPHPIFWLLTISFCKNKSICQFLYLPSHFWTLSLGQDYTLFTNIFPMPSWASY